MARSSARSGWVSPCYVRLACTLAYTRRAAAAPWQPYPPRWRPGAAEQASGHRVVPLPPLPAGPYPGPDRGRAPRCTAVLHRTQGEGPSLRTKEY